MDVKHVAIIRPFSSLRTLDEHAGERVESITHLAEHCMRALRINTIVARGPRPDLV